MDDNFMQFKPKETEAHMFLSFLLIKYEKMNHI